MIEKVSHCSQRVVDWLVEVCENDDAELAGTNAGMRKQSWKIF